MVNHESSPSRVRRKREEEIAAVGTPSKKSKRGGRDAEASPEKSSSKIGEDGDNGTIVVEGNNAEEIPQEIGSDGNAPSAVDPSAAAPAVTPEAASRPEPPAQEVYRIPSYAAWFRWDKVHPIERRAMGEFFDKRSASKTPRIYKEYRDFIINKYRENPKQPLTFNEVRRMLIGDVNSLSRVFDFLEHWGLINQQISLEQAASEAPPPLLCAIDSFPSGINVVRMPAFNAAKVPGMSTFESSGRSTTASHLNNLATRKNVFLSANKKLGPGSAVSSKKPEEEVHCHSCKKDCSKQRFYSKQHPGSSFCSDCVKAGKLPAGSSASELVQASDGEPTTAAKTWTSKETLLLLEAVSRYGENWNQVAAHVPTRSKLECVNHFIQLPFGDNYSVEPEEPTPPIFAADGTPSKHAGMVSASTEEAVLSGDTVPNGAFRSVSTSGVTHKADTEAVAAAHDSVSPFTDASHPLFAQIALLAGMVDPRVAAAAAQAAVAAIAEDDPGVLELPFMQSSKAFSGQKKHASQTMQIRAERLTEESTGDLQSNGEAFSQGGQPTTQKSSVPPNDPDAPKPTADGELPSAVQARISVATALGVAAANAKLLADQEEREIEYLVASIIDNQMKKLYSKLEHFEELEMLLEKERLEVERARQQVYADRLRYAELQTASAKSLFGSPGPS